MANSGRAIADAPADPGNWSLYLDLADLAAGEKDYETAASLVREGLSHESEDVTLRAAGAAYRFAAGGDAADLDLLMELAPSLPHAGYRDGLIEQATAARAKFDRADAG